MKKKIIIAIAVMVAFCGGYYGLHEASYSKLVAQYGDGFEKNVFGDYCKDINGCTVAICKPDLFDWSTNISINEEGKDGAIIYVDMLGGNHSDGKFDKLEKEEKSTIDANDKLKQAYLTLERSKQA